jgi:hypothetical protein
VPKAGFWSVGGYTIAFRRDGRWYADDEPIANERIAQLFSAHVRRDDSPAVEVEDTGPFRKPPRTGWVVDLGIDCQPVVVEDTPLVVRSAERRDDGSFEITTNDGVSGNLDPASLEVGADDVLYCSVDRGERGVLRARFLRPAYYALAKFIEMDGERLVLRAGATTQVLS